MLNPLIHKHPGDTLHYVYSILDFLESLPNEGKDGAFLSREQVFGYFCILQCLKNALKFELERTKAAPENPMDELPHPDKLIGEMENIQHPVLRDWLMSEFERAIDLCNKPKPLT